MCTARDSVRAERAQALDLGVAAGAGARPAASPPARSGPKRRARSSSTGCPTASHIRRTWRLRPSWIVSSIRSPAPRRAHARGRGRPVLELAPRSRSARSAASPTGPPPSSRGRSSRPRSADGSAGWRARRRWSAGSARWCRRPGARPDTGAAPSRRHELDDGRAPVRVARGRDDAERLVHGVERRAARRRRAARPSTVTRAVLADVAGRVGDDLPVDASRARRRSAPRRRAARRRRRGRGTWLGASCRDRAHGCNHRGAGSPIAWTSSCSTRRSPTHGEPRFRAAPGVGVGGARRARLRGDDEPARGAARGARARAAVLEPRRCASRPIAATAPSRRCSRPPTGARWRRC